MVQTYEIAFVIFYYSFYNSTLRIHHFFTKSKTLSKNTYFYAKDREHKELTLKNIIIIRFCDMNICMSGLYCLCELKSTQFIILILIYFHYFYFHRDCNCARKQSHVNIWYLYLNISQYQLYFMFMNNCFMYIVIVFQIVMNNIIYIFISHMILYIFLH